MSREFNELLNGVKASRPFFKQAGDEDTWQVVVDLLQSVQVYEEDWSNAYIDYNDQIYITRGMLNQVQTKEEMAFIIFHEIGHGLKGHVKSSQSKQALGTLATLGAIGLSIFTDFGQYDDLVDGALIAGTALTSNLIQKKFSRSQEFEADTLSIYLMKRFGLELIGIPAFWERLTNLSNKHDFFSTHPSDSKRIANMQSLINQNVDDDRASQIDAAIESASEESLESGEYVPPTEVFHNGTYVSGEYEKEKVEVEPPSPQEIKKQKDQSNICLAITIIFFILGGMYFFTIGLFFWVIAIVGFYYYYEADTKLNKWKVD